MTGEKVCPVVHRRVDGALEVLAFRHPSAGNQFVKGTIEDGEHLPAAAFRELREESGVNPAVAPRYLGQVPIGAPPVAWHFYAFEADDLPPKWEYQTEDDFGHVFSFFWHPIVQDLDHHWPSIFHDALRRIRRTR